MDDDSLRHLVLQLYDLAEGVVDLASRSPHFPPQDPPVPESNIRPNGNGLKPTLELTLKALNQDQEEEVVERAAIMEYDGGRPRDEAERSALGRILGKTKES